MENVFSKLVKPDQKIKGARSMQVMAITADNQIVITQLTIARRFLIDEAARCAWGITKNLKPFRGRMTQLIAVDSCVPQLTIGEEAFTDPDIEATRDECYQRAFTDAENSSAETRNYKMLQWGLGLSFSLVVITMIITSLQG